MDQFNLERELAHLKMESAYSLKSVEQFRWEIAARIVAGMLSSGVHPAPEYAAELSIKYTDALISELRKESLS